MHQPPRLPPMPPPTLPLHTPNRRRQTMTPLTCIEAEIDSDLEYKHAKIDVDVYAYFTRYTDIITKGVQQEGRFLTEALELYLKLTEISAKVENKETQTKKKITINTNKTYPQTHQKFKKYLQKKYKTKNIKNQDYNNEFNAAITIYTPILQEIAKEKEVDVYDLF